MGLSIMARFLEEIKFKEWVEESFPVEEVSPNGKGKYPKVLSLFLTALSGGNRFTHILMWGYGREAIKGFWRGGVTPSSKYVDEVFREDKESEAGRVVEREGEVICVKVSGVGRDRRGRGGI